MIKIRNTLLLLSVIVIISYILGSFDKDFITFRYGKNELLNLIILIGFIKLSIMVAIGVIITNIKNIWCR